MKGIVVLVVVATGCLPQAPPPSVQPADAAADRALPFLPRVCAGPVGKCPEGEYCATGAVPDRCPGPRQTGECQPIPESCPGEGEPVCGCDGQSYPDACHAALAGVAVTTAQCEPPSCASSADCSPASWCQRATGSCSALGTCSRRPLVCQGFITPVCACDGRSYRNACFASLVGVSVAQEGLCPGVPLSCGGPLGDHCPGFGSCVAGCDGGDCPSTCQCTATLTCPSGQHFDDSSAACDCVPDSPTN